MELNNGGNMMLMVIKSIIKILVDIKNGMFMMPMAN